MQNTPLMQERISQRTTNRSTWPPLTGRASKNLLKLRGNGFQFHFLRCISGRGVFHIALQMGLLFRYTNELLKKMCDSQTMQRFEKYIRSIVKNIGSERSELCRQHLAYFV